MNIAPGHARKLKVIARCEVNREHRVTGYQSFSWGAWRPLDASGYRHWRDARDFDRHYR